MKIKPTAVIVCLAVALLVAGYEFSCGSSVASLTDAVMAGALDAQTGEPLKIGTLFSSGLSSVYASARVSNAALGTTVGCAFNYLEGTPQEIAESNSEVQGAQRVSFPLSPPSGGWPLGRYEAIMMINGQEASKLPFSVVASAEEKDSSAARPSYRRVAEQKFGFSFDIPEGWSWELTPAKDYMISGPKGTDAFEVAAVVQIVSKEASAPSSLHSQYEQALDRLGQAAQSKLLKKGMARVAGVEAPFFIVKYEATDSQGRKAEFAHSQLVLETRNYYLWLSYSAPTPIYTRYLGAFQHMINTLEF